MEREKSSTADDVTITAADGSKVEFKATSATATLSAGSLPTWPDVLRPPQENAAEKISQDVGVVPIAAELIPFGGRWINPSFTGGAGGGGAGRFGDIEFHANGLPMVPWDGYPAILHKGERVLTAREVNNSRNFSSNLYVENMNMNGASAEGLAATMAAAQRRMMRGYGS